MEYSNYAIACQKFVWIVQKCSAIITFSLFNQKFQNEFFYFSRKYDTKNSKRIHLFQIKLKIFLDLIVFLSLCLIALGFQHSRTGRQNTSMTLGGLISLLKGQCHEKDRDLIDVSRRIRPKKSLVVGYFNFYRTRGTDFIFKEISCAIFLLAGGFFKCVAASYLR